MGIAPNFSPPQMIPLLGVCGNPHVRRIYAEGTAISNRIKKDKRFMVLIFMGMFVLVAPIHCIPVE
jgi:hypothetical protein